ncbi:hypothetical protein [Winogradskyella pulchriflava]|uniref:LTXXQ motif family protein n=1 Tax=Winogradskyella pulchriflava TaxID=1110688 RepID=A0ABV6Q3U3_9FLAO
MKKLVLIAVAFFTLNAVAQEQKVKVSTHKNGQKIEKHQESAQVHAKIETQKLIKQLNLTSDQQEKVYTVMLEHFTEEIKRKQELKKIIASKNDDNKAEIKTKVKKHRQEHSEKLVSQLKEILTTEQYEIYNKINSKEQKAKQKVEVRKN